MSVLPRSRDLVTRQVVGQSATLDPNATEYDVPSGYIGIQVWVGTAGTLVFLGQNGQAFTLVGIPAAALLQISDVIPDRKSLFSGRTDAEHERRRRLRRTLLSRIALEGLMEPIGAV